jgi:hypothetical protein
MIVEEIPDQECLSQPHVDDDELKPVQRHWSPPIVEVIKVAPVRREAGTMKAYFYYGQS